LALLLPALASPALAGVCTVPGSHATIQEAIDDPACTSIDLSAQTYAESINIPRTLTLAGPGGGGAIVEGLVRVAGGGTQATLVDLEVANGCAYAATRAVAGGEIVGDNLQTTSSSAMPCPVSSVFEDGFESGDTSAWSNTVP